MSGYLAPIFDIGAQFFTNQGIILAGGKIQVYAAGTTNPQDTWTDVTLGTKNSNPIILNSAGRLPAGIWLQQGLLYKFTLQDSTGATLGQPIDYVSGIGDPTTSIPTQWTDVAVTPVYASSSSFTMAGDQTAILEVGRRIKAAVTAGVVYGTIVTAVVAAGITTVTLSMDQTGLDSGLSLISVGVLESLNSPLPVTTAQALATQRQLYSAFTTTGTQPAYVLTPNLPSLALVTNTRYRVKFHAANGGAATTLNVGGLGAIGVKQYDAGGNKVNPAIYANMLCDVEYDGTNYVIITPVGVMQPGQISYFAMNAAPAGFIKANGAVISRTTYAALFAAIGTTFGAGDGSTTFQIPELRGEFIRGWDDAAGIDPGRVFGSTQGYAQRNLTGSFGVLAATPGAAGVFTSSASGPSAASAGTGATISMDTSGQVPTAAEVRPINVALLACIKY